MDSEGGEHGRAASPIIGNILLVAVVIIISVVLVTVSLTFLDKTGSPSADAAFEYEQTPVGLEIRPIAMGTEAVVKLNGRRIAEVGPDSVGEPVLLPTAPGDEITVVSTDEERSVLVNQQADSRDSIGDFTSYYTFDGSGSVLSDESGNGNDGDLRGDPDWTANGLALDGSGDYVEVTDISAPVDVDEFTIAVAYRADEVKKQELVEHKSGSDNWLLELKPCDHKQVSVCTGGDGYTPVYTVDQSGGGQSGQIFGGRLEPGTQHVVVGTFDGSEYTLYVDGDKKNTSTYPGEISMGNMNIGADFEFSGDYLNGEIYELRLYYKSFDSADVVRITGAMEP
ncbi:LamG domain-containing protein [Halovenus salina]|uniref:LamG domain-containing protein n=1 Tax=Halovenus salina TaxID=1510225 RepID=A0ABD5W809_9EURY|nr:LamG domain-containing protein [Halovenus salina]